MLPFMAQTSDIRPDCSETLRSWPNASGGIVRDASRLLPLRHLRHPTVPTASTSNARCCQMPSLSVSRFTIWLPIYHDIADIAFFFLRFFQFPIFTAVCSQASPLSSMKEARDALICHARHASIQARQARAKGKGLPLVRTSQSGEVNAWQEYLAIH